MKKQKKLPDELVAKLLALMVQCKEVRPVTLYQTLVVPHGYGTSTILFVSDVPREACEKDALAFRGEEFNCFKQTLMQLGLTKRDVWLTPMVKFRPVIRLNGDERPPSKKEIELFLPLLLEEIRLVSPKIVVALGSTVCKAILEDADFGILRSRGQFFDARGIKCPVLATFHPSYIHRMGGTRADLYGRWVEDLSLAIKTTRR